MPNAVRDAHLNGFRRLAVAASAVALVLVAVGGAVRATDSGLACPTWPGCFSAGDWLPPADLNVWLEHSHRLLAGVLALLIAALAVWTLARFRHRKDLLWPVLAAAVLVNVQAALGAVVVFQLLSAELVTMHLGLAMIVVACLLALVVNAATPAAARGGRLATVGGIAAALTFIQLLVGAHVTGIGAGLAYTDFPLMDGAVIPAVSNSQELFHALHRGLAVAVTAAVVWLCVTAVRERAHRRSAGVWTDQQRRLVTLPMWAASLVILQIVLGVANLVSELSALTVVPHLAVASWIWALLIAETFLARRLGPAARPADARQAEYQGRERVRSETPA